MNRLQSELHRLYAPCVPGLQDTDPEAQGLIDANGRVRAMVLALARPADWPSLATVWKGVQVDLGWPAPAIAVVGADGFQLWFSLVDPVSVPQATAVLDALRRRYLGEIDAGRVGLLPVVQGASPGLPRHAARVPAPQAPGGPWSAFVAPDLAPLFAEEPWLDMPPNPEGQAELLSRLDSIPPAEFERALVRLGPAASPVPGPPASDPAGAWGNPKRFLLDVMNNESAALGLRIDAAKALLPYFETPRRP